MDSGLLALVLGAPGGWRSGEGGHSTNPLSSWPVALPFPLWEMGQLVPTVKRLAYPSVPGPRTHNTQGDGC